MNAKSTPLVTIVLEHSGCHLSDTLWALSKQSTDSQYYEVLVCGPLTDQEQNLIASFSDTIKVKSVYLKPSNLANILNSIASVAKGELLIFSDTNAIPAQDFVVQHIQNHTKHSSIFAGFVGPRMWENKAQSSLFQHALNQCRHKTIYSHYDNEGIIPWDFVRRGNLSLKKEIITKISFPRENFETKLGEDLEFFYLLWLAGVRFTYTSDAKTYSITTPTIESLLKEEEKAGRDIARFINCYNDTALHLTAMIYLSKEALIVWRSKLEPLLDKYHMLLEGIKESERIFLADHMKIEHQSKVTTSIYALEVLLNLTRTSALIDFALSIPSLRSQNTSILH